MTLPQSHTTRKNLITAAIEFCNNHLYILEHTPIVSRKETPPYQKKVVTAFQYIILAIFISIFRSFQLWTYNFILSAPRPQLKNLYINPRTKASNSPFCLVNFSNPPPKTVRGGNKSPVVVFGVFSCGPIAAARCQFGNRCRRCQERGRLRTHATSQGSRQWATAPQRKGMMRQHRLAQNDSGCGTRMARGHTSIDQTTFLMEAIGGDRV